MPLSNPELWWRIEGYSVDVPSVSLPFTLRLARDNGWTRFFAQNCVIEYQRFCYLAIVMENEATPSDQVDQVWHLHLQYTHEYWDVFCKDVLKRLLHHGPTKGGGNQRKHFRICYLNTLECYTNEFGAKPPADIWPDADIRFDAHEISQRVNIGTNWIIPIPNIYQKLTRLLRRKKGKTDAGCGAGGCSGCGGCGGCGG